MGDQEATTPATAPVTRQGEDRSVEERGVPAYFGELIGTFMLVLFIGIILSVFNTTQDGLGYQDFTAIGLLHVFVLAMLIASIGGVSGAHFNPAVTITLLALRKIRGSDAFVYIALQLVGAILAALLLKLFVLDEAEAVDYGGVAVSTNFLDGANKLGLVAEMIGTFALMWAIMGVAVNPRAEKSWAPLIIGGTLGMAVMAIGPLTGAGFNPARAFGPNLVSGQLGDEFDQFLIVYTLGPIIGALLAGLAYHALILRPQVDLVPSDGERPVDKLD